MRKIKSNLSLVLAVAIILSTVSFLSIGSTAYSENGFTYNVSGGKATITDYTGSPTKLTIPSTLGGYPVTSIGDFAFSGCTSLESITIPDSVKSIGYRAFYNCTSLKSITIPDSVTSIGDETFEYCTSLSSITIPDSVTSIGSSAFYKCTSLSSITVDNNNTAYASADGVFFNKNKSTLICYPARKIDTSYAILDSVTSIGSSAFEDCTSLKSITIPDSVTSIGSSAFCNCITLKSITIPDSVTSISKYAFFNCISLSSITIPDSVTSIGDYAFYYCRSLTSITIPDSVTSIGDFAFSGCTSLTSITIPNSVTSIGDIDECNPDLTVYGVVGSYAERWAIANELIFKSISEFNDVKKGDWYYDAVLYATTNGLFNGTGKNTFSPNANMNRAMLVTVLYRMEGSPSVAGITNSFNDVKAGQYYYDAVLWASSNGVVNGVGAGKFAPDANVTREQMATILYRYSEKKGIDVSDKANISAFPDSSSVSSYAKDAIAWANGAGLIGGTNKGGKIVIDPLGNATRAQVATILMRYKKI